MSNKNNNKKERFVDFGYIFFILGITYFWIQIPGLNWFHLGLIIVGFAMVVHGLKNK